jgi:DNA-binding response OmpR family regulator
MRRIARARQDRIRHALTPAQARLLLSLYLRPDQRGRRVTVLDQLYGLGREDIARTLIAIVAGEDAAGGRRPA